MKVLVTGGAGFIGSHVVDGYLAAGHQVAVLDDLSTGKREQVHPEARFYLGDILDAERVFGEFRPEVVCHLAAQMSVKVSTEDPQRDAQANVMGLLAVLEAARQCGTRKVLFASSGGTIYGAPNQDPVAETHPTLPESPYGITKMVAEHYLRFYRQEHGLAYTSFRYGNVYGPRQDPHGEAGVVAIFTQRLLRGETCTIHWDGEQTKDYVYVGDVVRANLLALAAGDDRCFNIGSGVGTTVNQLYAHLAALCDSPDLSPQYGDKRKGDVRRFVLDCRKVHEHLGWQAEIGLEQGLKQTVAFFKGLQAASLAP